MCVPLASAVIVCGAPECTFKKIKKPTLIPGCEFLKLLSNFQTAQQQ
jgi:hypothetical protein